MGAGWASRGEVLSVRLLMTIPVFRDLFPGGDETSALRGLTNQKPPLREVFGSFLVSRDEMLCAN